MFEGMSRIALDAPIELWATDHVLMLGDQGAIIGHLFTRSIPSATVTELNPAEVNAALVTRGQSLIRDYWGGYVAIFRDPKGDFVVVRDPSGALPAFWRDFDGTVAVATQIGEYPFTFEDGVRMDADGLLVHLWNPHYAGEQTCLAGVSELLSGQRLQVTSASRRTDALWKPWSFLPSDGDIGVPEPGDFRGIILNAIKTWADAFPVILSGISGGLDSSIVTFGIDQSRAQLHGLHMSWDDREGDERSFALTMANALGSTLDIIPYDLGMIDIERPIVASVARPFTAHYAQCTALAQAAAANRFGIDAFFNGDGGDNVFCLMLSIAPILDRLRAQHSVRALLKTAADVARLTGADLPTILLHLCRRLGRDPRSRATSGDRSFLDPAWLKAAIETSRRHFWYDQPDGISQGKAAHIRAICRAMGNDGFHDRRFHPPSISPLLAQPVMEQCLKIPTWTWVESGTDRAMARRAFEHDLPPSIIGRRTKGGPSGFLDRFFWENEGRIIAYLRTGILAERGILTDLPESTSSGRIGPYDRSHARRLLGLTGAESWARQWTS
ncbi:asparagine synthase [Sphingobium sp. BS19]|nr:asparagine synthase [Sphingobium sp. BS19]